MPAVPRISEEEYSTYESELLHDLARQIAFSGMTISEIARATRLKWDTIYKASQGGAVRFDNYARLLYFLAACRKNAEAPGGPEV